MCDRYELVELISIGGMGRVYRALYRALDRQVAVKIVHPHLAGDGDAVARFMIEAQIASRLNHPNIVSIHNFGRTSTMEGGDVLMVMELLHGPSLGAVLRNEWPLPLARVADILCQTLGALAEAHARNITHRDVKPPNIVLERTAAGGDHVKLIDFGIARIETGRRFTKVGEVIGTPSYMSPEQASGQDAGAGADLYAVGVILFQMLTGALPFSGPSPTAILRQQASAPRPDPRVIAPDQGIPAPLADVCLRAIDLNPMRRYPTAEAFARAIQGASGVGAWTERRASLFRTPATRADGTTTGPRYEGDTVRPPPRSGSTEDEPGPHDEPTVKTTLFQPGGQATLPSGDEKIELWGGAPHILWALDQLVQLDPPRGAAGVLMHGRAGSGKSRLLREIATRAEAGGTLVVFWSAGVPPLSEVSYTGLRALVSRLVGAPASDPMLTSGRAASASPAASLGLRAIFADELPDAGTDGAGMRIAAGAALVWAACGAAQAVAPRRLLLVVDDVDHLDLVSQRALADLTQSAPIPGLRLLAASERLPAWWTADTLASQRIVGIARADAEALLVHSGSRLDLGHRSGDVEPLYIEQLLHWEREERAREAPPPRLVELIEQRLRRFSAPHRRALQAVVATGGGSVAAIGRVASSFGEIREAIPALARAGWVDVASGRVSLAHELYGRIAAEIAPAGALAELHARAADLLDQQPSHVELRAYHAIRGRPDFAAFLLVEEAATLRSMLGDEGGAIALLRDGLRAARAEVLRGATETATAWTIFSHKLGASLVAAGRFDEAAEVLRESLRIVSPDDERRMLVLDQLALAEDGRGRRGDADKARHESTMLSDAINERVLSDRLRRGPRSAASGERLQASASEDDAEDGSPKRASQA